MILKITGDTHGETLRLYDYMELYEKTHSFDKLLICGDFGYLWEDNVGTKRFLDEIENKCPFDILFVDGNHENFDMINGFPVEKWYGGNVHKIRNNIIHLMRGEIYEINGKKIFAFGGGYSIDKQWRLNNEKWTGRKSWWEQEFPTYQEIENALSNLSKSDWKVDYIFTHSAPTNVLPLVSEFFISSLKQQVDIVNETLEEIMEKTEFKHWYFGHYHGEKSIDDKFTILYKTSRNLEI